MIVMIIGVCDDGDACGDDDDDDDDDDDRDDDERW